MSDSKNRRSVRIQMQNFNKSTIDPERFHIEDVLSDDACFYRSIANSINYQYDFKDTLNSVFHKSGKWVETKGYENIDEYLWGYKGELQEELARLTQNNIRQWLYENKDKIVDDLGITYSELIEMTHELDIESYNDLYKHFAGDDDFIYKKVGQYKTGRKKGKPKLKKVRLQNRWGGIPEQYAISEILETPVIIYTAQKFNTVKQKIENGKIRKNKAEKNVRLKVFQIIGDKYNKTPITLLWKKLKRSGHYYSLCPKN